MGRCKAGGRNGQTGIWAGPGWAGRAGERPVCLKRCGPIGAVCNFAGAVHLCGVAQHGTVQCSEARYSAVRRGTVRCGAGLHGAGSATRHDVSAHCGACSAMRVDTAAAEHISYQNISAVIPCSLSRHHAVPAARASWHSGAARSSSPCGTRLPENKGCKHQTLYIATSCMMTDVITNDVLWVIHAF